MIIVSPSFLRGFVWFFIGYICQKCIHLFRDPVFGFRALFPFSHPPSNEFISIFIFVSISPFLRCFFFFSFDINYLFIFLPVVDFNQSIKGSRISSRRSGRLLSILSRSDLIFLHLYEVGICRFDFLFTTVLHRRSVGMFVLLLPRFRHCYSCCPLSFISSLRV